MLDIYLPEPPMLTHPRKLTQGETEYKQLMDGINAASADQADLASEWGLPAVLRMLAIYAAGQQLNESDPVRQSVWRLTSRRLNILAEDRVVNMTREETAIA